MQAEVTDKPTDAAPFDDADEGKWSFRLACNRLSTDVYGESGRLARPAPTFFHGSPETSTTRQIYRRETY